MPFLSENSSDPNEGKNYYQLSLKATNTTSLKLIVLTTACMSDSQPQFNLQHGSQNRGKEAASAIL